MSPRTIRRALWAAAAALVGCGGSPSAASTDSGVPAGQCPSSPASCPTDVPKYASEIAGILQTNCVTCHGPTGTAGFDESTYQDVFNQRSPILDQVALCLMPPSGSPQMTPSQRNEVVAWFVCGAPDN